MNRWINVSKKLPQKGQDVLAFCGWCITATYYHPRARKKSFAWHTEDGVNPIFHITHWMPLPKHPIVPQDEWIRAGKNNVP